MCRMYHAPRATLTYPQRNMLDGELLWRYPLLSNKERFDFAKQIGTTQNQVSNLTRRCGVSVINKLIVCSCTDFG